MRGEVGGGKNRVEPWGDIISKQSEEGSGSFVKVARARARTPYRIGATLTVFRSDRIKNPPVTASFRHLNHRRHDPGSKFVFGKLCTPAPKPMVAIFDPGFIARNAEMVISLKVHGL